MLEGRVWALQVDPSLVGDDHAVTAGEAAPAAQHSVPAVHDTAPSGPVPLGRVPVLQVDPPSVVATTHHRQRPVSGNGGGARRLAIGT